MGNIVKDIELRKTNSGKSVVEFGLALNDGKDQTTFVNVQAWEKNADLVSTFFGKGSKILVEGRLSVSSFEYQGQKRTKTLVVLERFEFVDSKKKESDKKENLDFFIDDGDLPFV